METMFRDRPTKAMDDVGAFLISTVVAYSANHAHCMGGSQIHVKLV